jgi:hypothetical protein
MKAVKPLGHGTAARVALAAGIDGRRNEKRFQSLPMLLSSGSMP